jgi:hypothetical protein
MLNYRPLKKAASPPCPSFFSFFRFSSLSLLRESISCKPDFFWRDFERRCAAGPDEGAIGAMPGCVIVPYEPKGDERGRLIERFAARSWGASSEGWDCSAGAEIVVPEDMAFLVLGNKQSLLLSMGIL